MPVRIETDWRKYPEGIRQHLLESVREKGITVDQLRETEKWLRGHPAAPDLQESPKGLQEVFNVYGSGRRAVLQDFLGFEYICRGRH